jgi:hypothetical protein
MNIASLMRYWEASASSALTVSEYRVRLPLRDAARVAALAEMYPLRSEAEILTELVSAALDELEQVMPYVPGSRVIAEDDRGDPIYEDIGPTPRLIALTEKHMRSLEKGTPAPNASPDSGKPVR